MVTRGEYKPSFEIDFPVITKVGQFEVGQRYFFDGQLCEIEQFPIRTAVVVVAVKPKPEKWDRKKLMVGDFAQTAELIGDPK